MGRSENSRNRVFERTPDGIRTRAFDESKMTDPSLIIYHPVRRTERGLIVTNGDQTDTICEGHGFVAALRTRTFEPDAPNWTPRISGLVEPDGSYKLSILRSADPEGARCIRCFYEYEPEPGKAPPEHLRGLRLSLPSFSGSRWKSACPIAPPVCWPKGSGARWTRVKPRLALRRRAWRGDHHKQIRGGAQMKEIELKYGCNPTRSPPGSIWRTAPSCPWRS